MHGCEWVVDAHGCDPAALTDLRALQALLDGLIDSLSLHPVGKAVWHCFSGPGGITGLCLLAESHFACHTFPEHQSLCLNLFCCRPRPDWDFRAYLERVFRAREVHVRRIERPFHSAS